MPSSKQIPQENRRLKAQNQRRDEEIENLKRQLEDRDDAINQAAGVIQAPASNNVGYSKLKTAVVHQVKFHCYRSVKFISNMAQLRALCIMAMDGLEMPMYTPTGDKRKDLGK